MKEVLEVLAKGAGRQPGRRFRDRGGGRARDCARARVAGDDMGKVIGKQGRIAKAIRTVVKAAASRENKRVMVEIVD